MKIITGIEKFLKSEREVFERAWESIHAIIKPQKRNGGKQKKARNQRTGLKDSAIMLQRKENIKSIGFMQNTAIPA